MDLIPSRLIVCAFAVVVAGSALGQTLGPGGADAAAQPLAQPVPVDFDAAPLGRVIADLAEGAGGPLEVDWAALRELGASEETPVTLRLPDVPAETAIRLAVYAAIAGASDRPAGLEKYAFLIRERDGVIRVSAVQRAERPPEGERMRGTVLAFTNEAITLRLDVPNPVDAVPPERTLTVNADTRVVVAGETTDRVTSTGQRVRTVQPAAGRPSDVKVGEVVMVTASPQGVALQIIALPARGVAPE